MRIGWLLTVLLLASPSIQAFSFLNLNFKPVKLPSIFFAQEDSEPAYVTNFKKAKAPDLNMLAGESGTKWKLIFAGSLTANSIWSCKDKAKLRAGTLKPFGIYEDNNNKESIIRLSFSEPIEDSFSKLNQESSEKKLRYYVTSLNVGWGVNNKIFEVKLKDGSAQFTLEGTQNAGRANENTEKHSFRCKKSSKRQILCRYKLIRKYRLERYSNNDKELDAYLGFTRERGE